MDDSSTTYDGPLIGALLRMPWEAVRRRMLEGLHEQGFDDLHVAHLLILQYPGPSGLRPSELADRTRMSKQALNYLLGQMERLGYITRLQHSNGGRFKRIELTERGLAAVRAKRAIVIEVEKQWERDLGAERFALLRELLTELQPDQPPSPAAEALGSPSDRDGAPPAGANGSRRHRREPDAPGTELIDTAQQA